MLTGTVKAQQLPSMHTLSRKGTCKLHYAILFTGDLFAQAQQCKWIMESMRFQIQGLTCLCVQADSNLCMKTVSFIQNYNIKLKSNIQKVLYLYSAMDTALVRTTMGVITYQQGQRNEIKGCLLGWHHTSHLLQTAVYHGTNRNVFQSLK